MEVTGWGQSHSNSLKHPSTCGEEQRAYQGRLALPLSVTPLVPWEPHPEASLWQDQSTPNSLKFMTNDYSQRAPLQTALLC